jgi:hypothetical protein
MRRQEAENTRESLPAAQGELSGAERAGWHTLTETLPRPTYWPAVMALGIIFILGGIVTSLFVSAVGVVLLAIALAGWIGEIRHENGD